MTGLLKDLMHDHADGLAAPELDVDALVRDGQRRVTRRRTAFVGGGAALAVVAVVAGLASPGLLSRDSGTTSGEPGFASYFAAHEPAWAIGSTIHIGEASFDTGHQVNAFVQTTRGVVLSDKNGVVWSGGDTGVVEVGRTDKRYPHLEADGPRAAWVDTSARVPSFAVLDQGSGEVVSSELANEQGMGTLRDEANAAVIFALDGDDLYLRDPRGALAWNFVTDEERVLGAANGFTIDDVRSGRIAYSSEEGTAEEGTTYRVGADLTSGKELPVWNGFELSPGTTYLLGEDEPDEAAVFDVATGQIIDAKQDGYDFFVGFGWVDDDSFVGLGLNEPYDSTPVDLLTCDVSGPCEVTAAAIGSVDDGIVLPNGESIDG